MDTLPVCGIKPRILFARSGRRWNDNAFAFTLTFSVVIMPPEVVWPIGSQSVLNASRVNLHLYFYVVNLIAIRSPKMHFNGRCKVGLCDEVPVCSSTVK